MASISSNAKGFRRLIFNSSRGERRTVYLGKIPKKQADTILSHVEHVLAAQASHTSPPLETSSWLGELGENLHLKLVSAGLASARQRDGLTPPLDLKSFLDAFIANRGNLKPATRTVYGHTRRCLIDYFGADKAIIEVTLADAGKWRRWLETNKFPARKGGKPNCTLSVNTVRRRCGIARQFFTEAVDDRLIPENPFRKLKGITVKGNDARDHFLSRADAAKVLGACPDSQWKLLFALSRFGGLRCPSEHLALKWSDVDWERRRLTIHSPKTEHHAGKGQRVIPIFPELRPYLEAVWDEAPEGSLHIITRYRDPNCNLRTQLERIIKRAGLEPWPKLFQNLRSTRQTELAETFPIHVVCQWIGNSQAVAKEHYLQVTDAHFSAAQETTRKTTRAGAVSGETEGNGAENPVGKHQENVNPAGIPICVVGGTRLELVTSTV